ncbi:MAG: PKD domain-containing protein [Bacteroidetes bacterium]|nr:MAG: PKD domain-containing protein [Bacteroidota bacterium]
MKNIINQVTAKYLVFLFLLISAQSSKGSHSMGADLTYECLGGNTYRITVSFYRDCIGIPAPSTAYLSINYSNCAQSLGVTCYPRPGTGQEVTPVCSSATTTCNGGSFTGIQEWIYDGIVTLPMQCTDWTFAYSLCCRNAAITNINNPGTSTFYIYANLNNTISPCNSSPVFSNKPVPFLCLGQQFCFNHGAHDPDGDSLVYELITPRQSVSATVNYKAPYNANNPLNSSPATSFSTVTGDICMTPMALEVTVMAVLVREFRNGVQIGAVERDLQLTVRNCNNNLPSLTGINGTNNFSITICANTQTCFDIFSIDPDAGQNLTVTWDYGIPGAQFNTSSGPRPTGTFCWNPSSSEIGQSFSFTATVADDACPYYGTQTYSYTVNVIGISVNAGPDQEIACSDLATLTAVASGGSGPYTYLWSTGSTMQSITMGTGTYWVTASDGTCTATDTVVVTMPYIPTAAFTYTPITCINAPITFTDQSTTPGGIITNWYWNFGDGNTSTIRNPVHTFPSAGTYNVSLVVENNLGCLDTIVQAVAITDPPVSNFNFVNSCQGNAVVFTDQSTPAGSVNAWVWNFGDGNTSVSQNPSHIYANSGTYTVTLNTTTSNGCTSSVQRNVTVYPRPVINAGADQTICAGNSITLSASGGQTYVWNPGGTGSTITVSPGGSTTYIVSGTDMNGCSSTDTVVVNILPVPNVNAGADRTICIGGSVTLTATGASSYIWNPGGMTGSTITVSPGSTTNYTVTGTSSNGCTASDAVLVTVNSLPLANAGPDANICSGTQATLTASGGNAYSWTPGGSTNQTITVSPGTTSSYVVTVTNANGCTSRDTVVVNVHQPPAVQMQSIFLCSGSSLTLDAGASAATYIWTPTGDTTRSITISSGGTYTVTATSSQGCSASASATVTEGTIIQVMLDDVSFCQGDSAVLDAGHPGMNHNWSTGQTSQSITIYNGGTYSVTVSDNFGCTGSVTINATVSPLPQAGFISGAACENTTLAFTDTSSLNSGSVTGWSWDFGDGNSSSVQNPSHTYTSSGLYSVQLNISSDAGCTSSVTGNVYINPLPSVDFSANNACAGSPVSFNDQSSVNPGNINSWSWNFGDGNTSVVQNPSHVYSGAGSYTVSLTVTTSSGCSATGTSTVTIHPKPNAAFSTSSVCQGNASNFINNTTISSGSVSSYYWNFGNASTSGQSHPVVNYSNPGNYNVQLIATSSFGCSDSVTAPVIVYPRPIANAGSDTVICRNSSATLSASGGTSYTWTPGNYNGAVYTVSPASNTSYTVTVTDLNGCTASDAVNVSVNQLPSLSASPATNICTGNTANLSASGAVTYTWQPGNIGGQNISVTPTSSTNYTVTGTDMNGCTATANVNVTVNALPIINAGPDRTICNGSTISISATGATSYNWNPTGMTGSSILVSPSSNTTYIVTGINSNGCQNSDTVNVMVNPSPSISLTPVFICQGFSAVIDAGNSGSSYTWSTGETTQSITVSNAGSISVTVRNSFGCNTNASTNVTVGNAPNNPPVQLAICDGQSATLDAGNPGSTYTWSNGSNSQTVSVSNAGNYSVQITNPNGCSAVQVHTLTVNPLPIASFSLQQACDGLPVNFSNQSSISSGSIQSYLWDFGDNTVSSTQSPSHTYPNSGGFTASLTVTSNAGCTSSTSRNLGVYPLPVARFSNTNACHGSPVNFTDSSYINNGNIASWNWNFGNNASASGNSASHTYANPGTYQAILTVVSDEGCTSSVSRPVSIYQLPQASISVGNTCTNQNANFSSSVNPGSGSIASYSWNFGDGSVSSLSNPSHLYSAPGVYSVQLEVRNSYGCISSANSSITSYPLPQAAFSAPDACQYSAISFTQNSTITAGVISSYYWNFGDNNSSGQASPVHSYSSSGTYTVSLIAVSSNGCMDTSEMNLTVNPLPQVVFSAPDACAGTFIQFNNQSYASNGNISSVQWDFGDGTISSLQNPVHTYYNPGTYNVQLTAISSAGCMAVFAMPVNSYPTPQADFASQPVCDGFSTIFYNQSYVPGGSGYTNEWSFGDGARSVQHSPVHQYGASGVYGTSLTVTSDHGCTVTVAQVNRVYANPVPDFSTADVCVGNSTTFTDNSVSSDGNISSWRWNFGDGSSSSQKSPVHTYQQTGIYQIELITVSEFGCMSRMLGTVEVFSSAKPQIQTANACAGSSIQFINNTTNNTGSQLSYSWDLGNGVRVDSSSVNVTYNTPGNYKVIMTATTAEGCSAQAEADVEIYPLPAISITAGNACENEAIQFNNSASILYGAITSYQWNLGNGQVSSDPTPSYTYSSAGDYQVSLTSSSDRGCVNSAVSTLRVHPKPSVSFNSGIQGCAPLNAGFTDLSVISTGNISGWLWNFGDGSISTNQNPQHLYTNGGSYDVTLTVVSDMGCSNTFTNRNSVTVFGQPTANFTADPIHTDILTPTVHFTNLSQSYTSFVWSFGDGTVNTTDINPVHTFRDTGIYYAQLITVNAYGCRDTVARYIEVRPKSTLFIPNCFTPNGDGHNDQFMPYHTNMEDIQVWIFDRWGLLLTEWNSLHGSWDGYYQGQKCQQDVYVYKIKGRGIDGKFSEWVGHVSIVY